MAKQLDKQAAAEKKAKKQKANKEKTKDGKEGARAPMTRRGRS